MADSTKLDYVVRILKEGQGGTEAARDLEKVQAAAGKTDTSLAAVAGTAIKAVKAFAALMVVQQVIGVFTSAIREFEAADRAAKQLDGTLRSLGRYTPELSGYLKQLANELEAATKVDDTEILGVISTLLRMGASAQEVGPMVQRALDISADGTTSLAAASEALGRAMQGEFGSIGRVLGKGFDESAGRAENFADAIRLVDERFRGMAQAAAASDTSLKGLKNEWNEMKESLGALLSEFIAPFIRGLATAIRNVRELFDLLRGGPKVTVPLLAPAEGKTAEQKLMESEDRAKLQRRLQELAASQQVAAAERAVRLPQINTGSGLDFTRDQAIARQEEVQKARAKSLISEKTETEELLKIRQQYYLARASLAQQGVEAEMQIGLQLMKSSEAAALQVQRFYYEQKEAIAARYEFEIEKAIEVGNEIESIEARKTESIRRTEQASRDAQWRVSETGEMLVNIGQRGAQAFTGGLASAIVNAARTGKAAFAEFFSDFFAHMAQAIGQALLLKAIGGVLGAVGVSPETIKMITRAEGGFSPRMAAMGAILGTSVVSGATYFPNFNTVAGEAGSEVLAVLSQPRMMNLGGLQSYVGRVQGSELAMTNARDLKSAVGNRQSAMGGVITVEVRGTKDFEARVVDSSIEGAVVRVVNDLHQDTPMSSAVKGLTA